MPLDLERMKTVVRAGTSVVCASCEHFWTGLDQGRSSCGYACGGPIAGMTFPSYRGPMTEFDRWCFVCGSDSVFAVRVVDSERQLGICRAHVKHLGNLQAIERPDVGKIVLVAPGAKLISIDRLVRRKPTLVERILETELELAKDDERRS